MKMFKKFACATMALIMLSGYAFAQEENEKPRNRKKEDAPKVLFAPHFYAQLQDGFDISMFQRTTTDRVISPHTMLNLGYNFTPVWGTRISGSYIQSRNNYKNDWTYTFITARVYADAVVNLSNAFSGFWPKRVVDVSAYAGVGAVFGIENYQANSYSDNRLVRPDEPWSEGKIFPAAHVGGIMGIRLSPHVKALIDAGFSFTDSRVSSKKSMLPNVMASGTVGIEYDFDPNLHEQVVLLKRRTPVVNYVTFGINAIDFADFGTLNLELDVNLTRHWVMGAVGKFNPWVFSPGTEIERMDQRTMAYLTTKYYPWYIFDGWHIDGMAGWSRYKTKGITGPKLDEGDKIGAGVGAGYTYVLSKHFNLELGAGLWMGAKVKTEGNKFFIEPYNVTVGISWIINPSKPKVRKIYED